MKNEEFYLISEVVVKSIHLKATDELKKLREEIKKLSPDEWIITSKEGKDYLTCFCYHKSPLNNNIKEKGHNKLRQIDDIILNLYEEYKRKNNLESLSDEESNKAISNMKIYGVNQKNGKPNAFKVKVFTNDEFDKFLKANGLASSMFDLMEKGVSAFHRFERKESMIRELMELLSIQRTEIKDENYKRNLKRSLTDITRSYKDYYNSYRKLAEDIEKRYYENFPEKKKDNKKDSQAKIKEKYKPIRSEQTIMDIEGLSR